MNLLSSLRYLAALDEHKHFGRAAAACYITQPALSDALRALEDEFGIAIVKRARVFGGFTPECERVLASAQRMLDERELLQQDLNSVAGSPQSVLTIGAVPHCPSCCGTFRGYRELEALPLVGPDIKSSIGFMLQDSSRTSLILAAALLTAQDDAWLRQAVAHSGLLSN